jgi:Tol biopolymer transport system component
VAPSEGPVVELAAGAILDGTSVDWVSAESRTNVTERLLLDQLKVVAAVADVHRRLQRLSLSSNVEARGDAIIPAPPEHWGHLRVLERIGRGAFGDVYRAWDTRLDREVALKLLPVSPAGSDSLATSIIEEGRLLARVRHPNVVTIYGAERIETRVGLWMELVKGRTLQQMLEQGKAFSADETVHIGIELCAAIEAVHAAGLLHRDIKPHNVMLGDDGHVVLMDFGTGQELSDSSSAALAGTPLYLAPELLSGNDPTVLSDIYSLGVLLYHLLTKSYPVRGESLHHLRIAHRHHERSNLRTTRRDFSPTLSRIIDRAIHPRPKDRYHSARSLADDLARMKGHRKFMPFAYALGAIIVGGGFLVYLSRPVSDPPLVPLLTMPLTSLPGQERHPSFSPDGNQITFAWDGENGDNQDIYIKAIGAGAARRLTTNPAADRTPVWSPDGRDIAFVRSSEEESGLFVIPALGGHERKIGSLTPPHEWPAGPSWSPNGQHLVLHDRRGPQAALSIFVFSTENPERRKLTSPPVSAVGDIAPAISPDGRTVAFNRISVAGGIYVVPLAGGEPKRVTLEQDWRVERLAWTPDGRELVFSSSGGATESSGNLWKVSASGGTPERLTVGGDDAANPAISIRGNRLAYEQRRQDANIWQIEVPTSIQPSHSPAKLIASTRHEAGPQFSPDGARIAFHSDRTGSFEIWMCDTAGSNLVQLTSFGGLVVGAPRWSPDGRRIAFDVLAKGHSDIHVVNVDGGLPQRITSETSDDVVPSWSKDGRWIYFASNPTGRHEVWKVPAAGGSAVQVTKRGGFAAFESNDGRFVYYSKGFDVDGLWRVAVNGGEEVRVLESPKAGFWGYWALVETGIYFVNTESVPQPALQFLSFAGRGVVPVAKLDRKPVPYEPGIAVSPDGKRILYTQEDHRSSDIMLVENFR